MRHWGEYTVEKEGNEVQHLEAHRRVGEEYIFRTRQDGTVYGKYNNDGSLGKSTRMLIGVWNSEKMDIRFKRRAAIDFCVQLGKDIGEMCALLREAYSEECFVKRMIQHWHKSFHDGRQETGGSPCAGWPCSSITEVNVNTLEEWISNRGHYFEKQPAMVFESNAE